MSPAPGGVAWRCFWKERTEAWRPAQGLLDSHARPLGPGRLPLLLLFFVLFGPSPRCLEKTYQGAGGGLAHLGQDAGFSTGGCQNPEDRKEQGEDGQDAIHLRKREPR